MISTKKRVLSAFMAILTVLSVMFTVNITAFADNTEKNFIFSDITGGVRITGYYGSAKNVVIPDTLAGKTVKEVKDNVFSNNETLEKLTIPASVEKFDYSMLESCPNLKSVVVDPNNENYASLDGVLLSKDKLRLYIYPAKKAGTSYKIPDETGIINSFCGNKILKSVDLSNNAYTHSIAINNFAFKNCTALENVDFGTHGDNPMYDNSNIGYRAFLGCTALKEIVIPSTVKSIAETPFAGCTSLAKINVAASNEKYCAVNGVLFEKDGNNRTLLCYPPAANNKEYTVPGNVTKIGYGAFNNCNFTEEITISDSVTEIGEYAFDSAKSVKKVNLGENITSIPSGCFKDSGLTFIRGGGKITGIGYSSFSGCTDLNNIDVIINNLTEIPNYAFSGCSSLSDIQFPESIKKIGYNAFFGCSLISSVKLNPNTAGATIGSYAFAECSSLSSVVLGDNFDSVDSSAFYDCPNLKTAEIRSMNTQLDYYSLGYTGGDDGFVHKTDIIIVCRLNSLAQKYAKDNEFDYEIIAHSSFCNSNGSSYDKIITEPDCTHSGTRNVYCTECGGLFARNITVPALGHNEEYTLVGYDATCTETGLTNGTKCSRCKEIVTPQKTIPAKGHGKLQTIKGRAATCTKTGLTNGKKCTVCNQIVTAQKTIPMTAHKKVTVKGYAATCSKTGLTDGVKCSVCNKVLTAQKTIPMTAHKKVTVKGHAATCSKTGLTDGVKCSVCDKVLTAQKVIPTTAHKEVTVKGYAATCTKAGLTNGVKCSVCNKVLTAQKKIPAAHKEVTVKGYAATCIKTGLTNGVKCSVCNKVLTEQKVIPVTDHTYKNGVCTVCGANEPISELQLKPESKLILDNENKTVIITPENTSGMKISEFKDQFTAEITVSKTDDKLIVNGGKFTFGDTEYTVIVKGDVNCDGKITAADARIMLRISAKLDAATDVQFAAADINSDSKVTAAEARNILRFSAKLAKSVNG